MSLPKGYKRLKYIQSSGTQYIDSLFTPNQDTRVVVEAEFAVTSAVTSLFGARSGNKSNDYSFGSYSNYYRSHYGTDGSNFDTSIVFSEKFKIDKNKNITTIGESNTLTAAASEFTCPSSMTLFTFSDSSGARTEYCATAKFYSCQIYDNGTLVRDFIPCQNASGSVGLWDAVNSVFYGNAGTGTFAAGPVVPEAVDESEITELEYIQSSGTQYINTEFFPNQDTRIVLDVLFTNEKEGVLFGSRTSTTANNFSFLNTGTLKYRADYNTAQAMLSASKSSRFVLDMNKNVLSFDGENIHTFTYAAFQGTYPVYLFVLNNAGSTASMATATLYSCQIYDNGLLESDFIPCKNADGEVGLYDRVYHEFYRNAGTGEFIAGPEAATVPKAPANFRVVSETDSLVTLAWDASDKAVGYRLYRSGQLLADTEETSVSVAVEPFAGAVFTLTAYNENGEGEGSTLTYFKAPDDPILFLITDRTQQDVTERNSKGYYAASDLNRVGYAVEYLAGRLKESGVTVTVAPVMTWTDAEWGTPTAMRAYLADVQTMRGALKLAESTPTIPEDMEKLTYTEANQIEMILLALDTHIKNMLMTLDAGWAMGLAYTGLYAKEAYR